jgi:acyl-CoA thioesterase FadM
MRPQERASAPQSRASAPQSRASAPFRARYAVRIGDINYGGHMGNDKYLLLFHDARLAFLASLGVSEKDIGGGAGLIMSEVQVRFQAEIFLGDELEVSVGPRDVQASRFALDYQVTRIGDGTEAASGFTTMAAFDYAKRRVTRLPEAFQAALTALTEA